MYRWFVRSITIIFCFLLLCALLNLKRIGTPLPDGGRLIMAGTTHGKGTHTPPPAPRTIGSVVRSAAGQDLWENYSPIITESDETLFWFRRLPGEAGMLPLAAAASDESGNTMFLHFDGPYLRLPALACWGKEIRLTVYSLDGESSIPATTYKAQNAFAGKYKPFIAEPFPAKKKAKNIDVTLEKFGNVPFTPDAEWLATRRRIPLPYRSRIKLTARENGAEPKEWRIEWPVVETPSGHRQEFLLGRRSFGPDQELWSQQGRRLGVADFDSSFSIPLPPENVRLTVILTNVVERPENELVFPDVPVPESNGDILMTTCTRNGSIIELDPPLMLRSVAQGMGEDRTFYVAFESGSQGPFRNFEAGKVKHIMNSHGKPLMEPDGDAASFGGGRGLIGNEQTVSIHFIRYETQKFEFYVKPELYEEDS